VGVKVAVGVGDGVGVDVDTWLGATAIDMAIGSLATFDVLNARTVMTWVPAVAVHD